MLLSQDSHNKHCYSMSISLLLIDDYIIAVLSRSTNIWKRYFQPLNAINRGIDGGRVQNFLWRCDNLLSSLFPNSYHNIDGSNVSGSNVRSSKSVSASNIYSVKPIYSNNVGPSRPIFRNIFCQRNPIVLLSFQVNLFAQYLFC